MRKIVARQLAAPTSKATDFVLVTHLPIDHGQNLRHDYSNCGLTTATEFGMHGQTYSWVGHVGGDCANRGVYTHEWLHQVEDGLHRLSGFSDLYGFDPANYPACGMGDPDPTRWFPSTHFCIDDPDYASCLDEPCGGEGEPACDCGTTDQVNEHILRAHWKPGRLLISNHCKNNVLDDWFGYEPARETSVDRGGWCPPISEEFAAVSNFSVVRGGTFGVTGGKFVLSNPATTTGMMDANLAVHNTSLAAGDFVVGALASVVDTTSTANDLSLVINYQDNSNYYYANFAETNDSTRSGIFKVQNGFRSQIGDISSTIAAGAVYKVELERKGTQINAYRAGQLVGATNDSTFAGGRIGVGSRDDACTFDDIVVVLLR
jgi:hypothetical protein